MAHDRQTCQGSMSLGDACRIASSMEMSCAYLEHMYVPKLPDISLSYVKCRWSYDDCHLSGMFVHVGLEWGLRCASVAGHHFVFYVFRSWQSTLYHFVFGDCLGIYTLQPSAFGSIHSSFFSLDVVRSWILFFALDGCSTP